MDYLYSQQIINNNLTSYKLIYKLTISNFKFIKLYIHVCI